MGKATQSAINQKVRLQRLLKRLSFTDEELVEAALEQPRLYLDAARYHTQRKRALTDAEVRLSAIETEVGLEIRKKDDRRRATDGGRKISESHIKVLVGKDDRVVQARERVHTAELEELWAKEMKEAYRHRRDMLRVLGGMLGPERLAAVFKQHAREAYDNSVSD